MAGVLRQSDKLTFEYQTRRSKAEQCIILKLVKAKNAIQI